MASFRWDSCFVTGLEQVDAQHHQLVDLINRFGDLLTQREQIAADELEKVFSELADYAIHHFRDEEEMMRTSQLDPRFLEQHRQMHRSFIDEVTRMHASLAGGDGRTGGSLLRYLTHWLAYHILGMDKAMARQIEAIRAGQTPAQAYVAGDSAGDPATDALLHALNGLFQQVSERNQELLELNQTLEARVAQRTLELSDANQRLEQMALTDALTGLPNRRHALRDLAREWAEASRDGTPLACLMIDADGFKQINDTQGHEAGDVVLRELARELTHAARTDDLVCRLGGDEFFVICARTPLDGALKFAEKLRSEVAQLRVPAGNGEWRGSISVGVAARSAEMQSIEDLMRVADDGVYIAKRNGRNCVASGHPQ